jgi:hypothetical protein
MKEQSLENDSCLELIQLKTSAFEIGFVRNVQGSLFMKRCDIPSI